MHALLNIASTQPPIFKMWLGQELVVTTSRLQDLEIILNKCVDRGKFFRFGKPVVGDGMLTSLRKSLIVLNYQVKKWVFKLQSGARIGKLLLKVLVRRHCIHT